MPTDDDIKRLDGRIDGVVKDQQHTRESVAGLRVQVTSHEANLGKVNELEKGMVRLNTQFGEFKDGVKEDLSTLQGGQDKILELFNADIDARDKQKKEQAQQREDRADRNWSRLLQIAAILALVVVTLVAAYISTGRI